MSLIVAVMLIEVYKYSRVILQSPEAGITVLVGTFYSFTLCALKGPQPFPTRVSQTTICHIKPVSTSLMLDLVPNRHQKHQHIHTITFWKRQRREGKKLLPVQVMKRRSTSEGPRMGWTLGTQYTHTRLSISIFVRTACIPQPKPNFYLNLRAKSKPSNRPFGVVLFILWQQMNRRMFMRAQKPSLQIDRAPRWQVKFQRIPALWEQIATCMWTTASPPGRLLRGDAIVATPLPLSIYSPQSAPSLSLSLRQILHTECQMH